LDDLPGLGWVRLPVYLAVWLSASALLGWFARDRGVERITGAVLLGSVVGAGLDVIDAVSLFSVRQVPMARALWLTGRLHTIFPALLLAAGAGALAGRAGERSHAGVRISLAWLAAGAGALDMVSAVFPHGGGAAVLQGILPAEIPRVASAATVAAGAGLLIVARALARGNRRGWLLAEALLASSCVLHLLRGLDQPESIATGIVAVTLLACRSAFDVEGDPRSRLPAIGWAGSFLAAIYVYGGVALFVNRALADRPWSPAFAAEETTRALMGLSVGGSAHVGPPFGGWFPLSVMLLATIGVIATLEAWLRPWHHRVQAQVAERAAADALVRTWGRDTLAPFTLRADKEPFFSPTGDAFLAYAVRHGIALVSGDPIGPPDSLQTIVGAFLPSAHRRGWRVAVLGAAEGSLAAYRGLGLRSLYWGDEAIVDTATFTLEGRPIRKVRQSVHRLERAGYRLEVRFARDVDERLLARLSAISRSWAGGATLGYVMSLEGLRAPAGTDAVFAIGFDADGDPQGFLHLAVHDRASGLSLSTMPRRPDTPNGFNEWLIAGTIAWARERGIGTVSLNFAPFAQLLDPVGRPGPMRRAARRALLALKSRLGLRLDNLLVFAGHFSPRWEARYVVFERPLDLPRVGVAGLRAEGYLGRRVPG
jgi:lysyl-tRNA synthetase, class II